jgi:hypothetical protein
MPSMNTSLSLGEVHELLVPGADQGLPRWPADAFAVALTLLRRADAYSRVVEEWPPEGSGIDWEKMISGVASEWRAAAIAKSALPAKAQRWWQTVMRARSKPVSSIRTRDELRNALLQIVAAADEASRSAGIWDADIEPEPFGLLAMELLLTKHTLCRQIHPTRAVVFPKLHTPQRGVTARSLSHHLALHETREVVPRWYWFPDPNPPQHSLNLLVLPWPETVKPREFREADGKLLNMPEKQFGFFTWDAARDRRVSSRVRAARDAAASIVGRVDAIVFPEMALAPGMAQRLCGALGTMIIGGEGRSARAGSAGSNSAVVALPLGRHVAADFRQSKHHRWRVDGAQIRQYGLGSQLDPTKDWWENITIGRRELCFWTISGWLNFCVLICEDLARQDPVGDLVRAVGPNLVIALLMDGPQLESRWPAKYATVLADDPGSSVLTLTSLGMARLSRPPGKPESRVVALWKDPAGPAVEIDVPKGATGAVLCLTREYREEHSADGRGDGGFSGYIRLHGVHPVFVGAEG